MTDSKNGNGRIVQLVPLVIAGLIFIINGFALFWLSDVKGDVRELRQHYVGALTEVGDLKVEVSTLNVRIENLNGQIVDLKDQLKKNNP